jgi:hypothetical protein
MKKIMRSLFSSAPKIVFLALLTHSLSTAAQEPLKSTDSQCLTALVDKYFAALVAHNPRQIPFAMNARFVENVDAKPIGEGLWRTATAAPTTFKIYVPDPALGEIGFMGMMEEEGRPLMIGLRLKVVDGLVTEAEHVLARGISQRNLQYLQTVRPALLTVIPEGQRMKRYEIAGIAYSYYDALNRNNGHLSPMSDTGSRRENGSPSSNSGIPDSEADESPNYSGMPNVAQFNTNMMAYIDDIDNVRVFAVDPVSGLAMGFSHFRHSMLKKTTPIYNVPGVSSRSLEMPAFDLPAAHVFKISKGEIHDIEAMGFATKYLSPSGWE